MMIHLKRVLFLFTLVAMGFNGNAIVYTIQKGYSVKDVRNLLKTKHVLRDVVTVNGKEGNIDVYISPLEFKDILVTLKPVVTDTMKKVGQGTVVIDVPGRGWTTRLLVLYTGTKSKVVVFQLRLPENGGNAAPANSWPAELPSPLDATVDSVMTLKKSKSTFCQFSRVGDSGMFNSYEMTLNTAGWQALSSDNLNGGVYLHKTSGKMLILSTWKDDKRAYGSVYLRPITNAKE